MELLLMRVMLAPLLQQHRSTERYPRPHSFIRDVHGPRAQDERNRPWFHGEMGHPAKDEDLALALAVLSCLGHE